MKKVDQYLSGLFLMLFVFCTLLVSTMMADQQAPGPGYGARLQRTMTLLATSGKLRRHTVKILFYGQSITRGLPAGEIIAELKKRYPYANIIWENRAIGGNTAPALVRTAAADLYPFYPDLLVFHVYRGETSGELERLLHNIRQYTTAEILMYTHHVRHEDAAEFAIEDHMDAYYQYIGQKYNCELVQVRPFWKDYLKENNLKPSDLLSDQIHLNPRGKELLKDLILQHFQYNACCPGGWYEQVRTCEARRYFEESDSEIQLNGEGWRKTWPGVSGNSPKGRLTLKFQGNRVDVVSFSCPNPGTAGILIDGAPPSSFPQLYACSKVRPAGDTKLPPVFSDKALIYRVSLGATPKTEHWTLTVTRINGAEDFDFEVSGSVTGPDGKGNSKTKFVSTSGIINIDPMDFVLKPILGDNFKVGTQVEWNVIPMFLDQWNPGGKSNCGAENQYTLAQGLKNGEHVLEIIPNGDGMVPISSIIVYRPPLL